MPESLRPVTAVLASWLPRARWFAGNDGDGLQRQIAIHDRQTLAWGSLLLVDVVAGGGEPHRYVVPVDEEGNEAATTPGFAAWLTRIAGRGLRVPMEKGTIVGRSVGTFDPATALPEIGFVRPIGADASNTSMLLATTAEGPGLAVKLLRRCRPGIQPEVEVGEFFSTRTTWAGTPRLRGWLDYVPHDAAAEPTVLATIHDALPDCVSAWDRLGTLVAAGGLHGGGRDRLLAVVSRLGTTTAAMHAALASRPDIPAFAPEPATAQSARGQAAGHAEPLRGRLLRFSAREPELAERLQTVAASRARLSLIRVHGDYHLGQVLLDAADTPTVIDFEGEPGRPLAERRLKVAACRDVAGMCRSFDYLLRHAAMDGHGTRRGDDLQLLERTFLDAYAAAVPGSPWWPATGAEALLDAFKLDKAVYELAYEIRHHPGWIEVPLAALEAA